MKKPEWLFVIALLLVGVFFGYKYFSKPVKFDPLQLVPKSSVAVYESDNILNVFSSIQSANYWQDLLEIDELNIANKIAVSFDSIVAKNRLINKALKNNRTLISLHVTGNESAGLMFYLPTGVRTRMVFEEILQHVSHAPSQYKTRVYDGLTIHELSSGNLHLAFINHKNYVIASTVGYLVEDVVRNLNHSLEDNFLAANSKLSKVPKLNNDIGNLYINGVQLTAFYNTLMPALKPHVGELAQSAFMDLSQTDDDFFMSGFLFDSEATDFSAIFRNQEAGPPSTLKLVPDDAATVMAINLSDVKNWHSAWMNKYSTAPKEKNKDNIKQQSFIKNISREITLISFNSPRNNSEDKLLLMKLADKEGMLNVLNKEAEDIASQQNDTVYFENYANFKIGLIEKDEMVSEFLGIPFNGFSSTYFMLYGDYLVLSSSSERIKKWLADIENDFVWGKSAEMNSFIEENFGETTFAILFNNPWSWNLAEESFNQKYQHWWQENEKIIKQFSLLSCQFTNLDNRFYSEVKLVYQPQIIEIGQQQVNEISLTQFTHKLIRKPKLVKNHNNGLWEILVQDSTNNLILLDDKAEKILWQDSLSNPIVGDIYQIDFLKNGQLQYLFATDSSIYIVDRHGNPMEGFPKHFTDFQINHLNIIDYDYSKNYRFLIADNSGNLRMFNGQIEPLEGWRPRSYNSTLSKQFFHVRVRGKDRIVVGLQNGLIDLRNRRAVQQPGFPIDLEFNLANPLYFNVGSTFKTSRFTTISADGTIAEFDLDGNLYAQKQLYQPSSSSIFSLIVDADLKDYIITRQDINRLAVMAKDGQVIFEKDYQSGTPKKVQYYSFGVDKQLFVVRDMASGMLYLYDKNGNLINADDVYSDFPVSVVYKKTQSKCYIYTVVGQTMEINDFAF